MAVPARMNIVTLGVEDVDRSASFYEALGWERAAASNDEIVWFKMAGTALGLYTYELLAFDAKVPVENRPCFSGVTLAINLESEAAVDAAMAEAVAAGAAISKEPQKADWGGYSGYFTDPDGFLWELAYNPFFEYTDDGHVKF